MNANEKLLLDSIQGVIEDARSLETAEGSYVTLQGNTFTLYDNEDKPRARLQLVPVDLPETVPSEGVDDEGVDDLPWGPPDDPNDDFG